MKPSANLYAGLAESYIPDGIEGLASICQSWASAAEVFPLFREQMAGFPADFEAAYKQGPSKPEHMIYTCTALFSPHSSSVELGFFRATPFGGSLAPNNWSEICFAMAWVAGFLLAIPMPTCVDDTSTAELSFTAQSAHAAWLELNQLVGWRVDLKKSPPPSKEIRSIRVWVSLPCLKQKRGFTVAVLEDRAARLVSGLSEVSREGKLSAAQAAKWRGRLYFASSVGWYGAARAALGQYHIDRCEVGEAALRIKGS